MKNLYWSIGTYDEETDFFRNIYSVSRMYKHGHITRLLKDGEYPFIIDETSWFPMNEIPQNPLIEMKPNENFPEFTQQTIRGTFIVKNGKMDLKHLDKQIPEDFRRYNSHYFVEGFSDFFTKEFRILLGS
jgi:hypothetical protein